MKRPKVVLVSAEEYDRLYQDEGVQLGVLKSKKAFLRDLPGLLENAKYTGWLVAYCGTERVAIARSEKIVIQECLKKGLQRDQYYIGVVAPYDQDGEIERSLYEFDPIQP